MVGDAGQAGIGGPALTPWLLLTPDIQVIGPSQKKRIVGGLLDREYIDTATVLGVRLQLIL